MKRRVFLKSAVVTGSFLASPGLITATVGRALSYEDFTSDEAKSILIEYFNKIFRGDKFDVNALPVPGILTFADSFDIEMTEKKTSIFDIAEVVIERTTKEFNFDASSLLEGRIPEGMEVGKGFIYIKTNEILGQIKFPELKNYDAQIIVNNPISIKHTIPIDEIKNINNFDQTFSNDKIVSYVDKKAKVRIYKYKMPIYYQLIVNSLNPLLINRDERHENAVLDKKIIGDYFSTNLNNLIL